MRQGEQDDDKPQHKQHDNKRRILIDTTLIFTTATNTTGDDWQFKWTILQGVISWFSSAEAEQEGALNLTSRQTSG